MLLSLSSAKLPVRKSFSAIDTEAPDMVDAGAGGGGRAIEAVTDCLAVVHGAAVMAAGVGSPFPAGGL